MYNAYGLLQSASDFTLAEAARRLSAKFPNFAVEQRDDAVVVSSPDWEIHMSVNEAPGVLEESAEIARHIGGAEDAKDIAACARRVELVSDVPDRELDHFSDYQSAIEVLQSFKGLIAVDPREPSLL